MGVSVNRGGWGLIFSAIQKLGTSTTAYSGEIRISHVFLCKLGEGE
jgi:hypothetical protein